MNYSGIKYADIANGTGVRVSLFVSGCRNHCEGCFNKQTWDFNYGSKFTYETLNELIERVGREYISGITILGGEPFEPQNINTVTTIIMSMKQAYPHKDVWVYTGYLYENLKDYEAMKYIDILVDGRFIQDKKDISLKFRGSSNQRIIDVKKSLQKNETIIAFE